MNIFLSNSKEIIIYKKQQHSSKIRLFHLLCSVEEPAWGFNTRTFSYGALRVSLLLKLQKRSENKHTVQTATNCQGQTMLARSTKRTKFLKVVCGLLLKATQIPEECTQCWILKRVSGIRLVILISLPGKSVETKLENYMSRHTHKYYLSRKHGFQRKNHSQGCWSSETEHRLT